MQCDYRSRSAFKLKQLDDEYLFLRKDRVVLDLGCYPGGWCQVAAKRCLVPGHEPTDQPNGGASTPSTSRVIGVDVAQMDPVSSPASVAGTRGCRVRRYTVLGEEYQNGVTYNWTGTGTKALSRIYLASL